MESFGGILKLELVFRTRLLPVADAPRQIFDSIARISHTQRLHGSPELPLASSV